jgi:hypothetical protein
MPNRVIRDAILDSERYHALSIDARCLFYELTLCADDYGLLPVGDLYLKRHCPACEGKSAQAIAALIEQIAAQQMIIVYVGPNGGRFAVIPKFGNWPRAFKPKWPLPPEPLFSVIKALAEKRSAYATQAQRRRTASAHETETETVTVTEEIKTKTPAGPVDPSVELWSFGVEVLTRDGKKPLSADQARSFIGSLRKSWTDETVLDALQAAVGTDDPKAYARAVLAKKPKIGAPAPDEVPYI